MTLRVVLDRNMRITHPFSASLSNNKRPGVGPSKWLKGSKIMWDTVTERAGHHLSHEMPCTACGHAPHTFLPCSDTCDCTPPSIPGSSSGRTVELVLR
jgi:hypothetical protein